MKSNYLKSNDSEMEQWVAEIKIRARRKLGEISKGLETVKTGGEGGGVDVSSGGYIAKKDVLKNAGISQAVSSRCEKLAAIPEEKFEEVIAERLSLMK